MSEDRVVRQWKNWGGKGFALAAALATTCAVQADVIWRKSGHSDGAGVSSFNTGAGWANGEAPSAANEYRWSGASFRTPDRWNGGDFVFLGKNIHFGKGSTIVHKSFGTSYVEFPEAVFGWEGNDSGLTWSVAAENVTARAGGHLIIQTPEATPLLLGVNRGTSNVFLMEARFSGAAGTAVAHSHMYGDKMPDDVTGFLYLKGDNSDYKGIWKLYNHNNAKDRAGVVLVLDHPHAAGGDPGTFRDDAIQIWNNGALAVTPNACADGPFAPVNRGIKLTGAARVTTLSDEVWSLGMPITGPGGLMKTGVGTVRLCAAYTANGPITVADGTLALSDGFAAPNGPPVMTVAPQAALMIEPLTGAGLTLDNLALPDGSGFSPFAATDGSVGVVTLGDGCTLGAGPYKLSLAGDWSKVAANADFAAVRIPKTVREVSADDFVLVGRSVATLPRASFSVRAEDGVQTVYVSVRPVVELSEAVDQKNPNGGQWFASQAETWADGQSPSADKDYVVQRSVYNTLRTTNWGQQDYVFPGGSLTMNASQALAHKGSRFEVSNFVLHANVIVSASGNGLSPEQIISGTMFIADSAINAPVRFMGFAAQFLRIESEIRGRGSMSFRPYDFYVDPTSNYSSLHTLTGDNSGFTGKIAVKSSFALDENRETDSHAMTLAFTRPEALGGSPASFECEGIRLDHKCWLKPLASMTYETPNRGLRNAGWMAGIEVPEDVAFNLKTTVSYTGALQKEGSGTLGLGGTFIIGTPTWDATNDHVGERGILRIEEGWIKPLATTAFTGLKLTFGVKGGIAVDVRPEDASVAQYGLFNAYVAHGPDAEGSFVMDGETLPVRIDGLAASDAFARVTICTVPAETAAKLRGRIVFRRTTKGITADVEEDVVTIDGEEYTRFTAVCHPKGTSFYLR